ncbi:MAG: ribonuclease P protein component [Piscinibacter sp.]|nr:ribonuclease P protein component [Piscinibacter sp.]
MDRIVRSVDFERVLRCPPRSRSAHFALHHLAGSPTTRSKALPRLVANDLSTGHVPVVGATVDDSPAAGRSAQRWLGIVLPKRHARRAVTRSLLKRQIRQALVAREARLPGGLWVVRLRAPFDRERFPSAASQALREHAGAELARLLDGAEHAGP